MPGALGSAGSVGAQQAALAVEFPGGGSISSSGRDVASAVHALPTMTVMYAIGLWIGLVPDQSAES